MTNSTPEELRYAEAVAAQEAAGEALERAETASEILLAAIAYKVAGRAVTRAYLEMITVTVTVAAA